MLKRQRYFTFGLLLAAAVLMGVFLPGLLNSQMDLQDPFFNTPRPTSTRFKTPIIDIVDVVHPNQGGAAIELSDSNCTYPVIYWKDHPDSWPAEIIIAGKAYTKNDVRLLFTTQEPDIQTLLTRHLYTSFLNILHGADMGVIESTILEASGWITTHPSGNELSEFNRQRGLYLIQILENYNDGQIGPGPCKDSPGTATQTPTSTLTFTPAPPTDTPTPTQVLVVQPRIPPLSPTAQPNPGSNQAPPAPTPTSPSPTMTPRSTFTATPTLT
jgi:hypothetical protein